MKTNDEIIYDYIISLLNTPFIWKGKSSLVGYDSASLIIDILVSQGFLFPNFEGNVQHLYNWISDGQVSEEKQFGSIAFFGANKNELYHCGFLINRSFMVEMFNGKSTINSKIIAQALDSRVRIMPIDYRKDLVKIIKPLARRT